jgi:prepilin peptidase CpaA
MRAEAPMTPQDVLLILLVAFPVLVIVAALKDATSYLIPNWISLALVAAFAPAAITAWVAQVPLSVLAVCVGVGFAALLAGMAMFAFGWIGGGDAKLMAASALWLGLGGLAPFLLWTTISGGGLAMLLLVARRHGAQFVGPNAPAWFSRLFSREADVPYGVAIAFGALMGFPHGVLATAVILPF